MVAADYGLSREIGFSNSDAGQVGAAIGGLVGGRYGGLLGKVGGALTTKEASTLLTLVDQRSGVQIAASEGSASKAGLVALAGSSAGGRIGGYTNTPQGKVIAAAYMDAFNQMVVSLREYKGQTVRGQGLGGGGRLAVDGGAAPSQTSTSGTGKGNKRAVVDSG